MLQSTHLEPGARLERYELLWPIAQGGMGSVWLARLTGKRGFEKLVAIKTILPEHVTDERFERMLLDEARIASGIEHPNVAQILDLGEHDGLLYLVMEWVDGESLSKLHRALRKKDLWFPLGVALRVVADACGGLHAAHELRGKDGQPLHVVHRDVSPQNILVGTNGAAKVIDFGIAKAVGRLAGETSTGSVKGKVSYMAPEQAIGRDLDRRSDVWALGAVLYFLLSGKAPFESENQMATLGKLVGTAPPPPLPSTVPAPVARLVMQALAHDPGERPDSAANLQRRLEETMSACGVLTTAAEVAAFLEANLGERAAARREVITRALDSAERRASGLHEAAPAAGHEGEHATSSGPMVTPLSSKERAGFHARPSVSDAGASWTSAPEREPRSEISVATLGSAAVVVREPASARKRALVLGAVSGFILVAGAVASTLYVFDRSRAAASPPSAEAPSLSASAPSGAPPSLPPPATSSAPAPAVSAAASASAAPAASSAPAHGAPPPRKTNKKANGSAWGF